MKVSAILLCGGSGTRFGSATPKVFHILEGKEVALWAFDELTASASIDEVVVVCPEQQRCLFSSTKKAVIFADPGRERQDSVYNGISVSSSDSTLFCVHDAARPFITAELIESVIAGAIEHGAAAPAVAVKDTIKIIDCNNMVVATPERIWLRGVQTPQAAQADLLKQAFAQSKGITVTDDLSLVEALGIPVKLVAGDSRNIKITTPEDLFIARALAKEALQTT